MASHWLRSLVLALVLDLMPLKGSSATEFTANFNMTNPRTVPASAQGDMNPATGCPTLTFAATKQSCSAVVEVLQDTTLVMANDWLDIQNMQE